MKKLKIDESYVYVVPVIHGLVEEGKKVEKAFDEVIPECIAIGISPEDIEAIKNKDDEIPSQYEHYLANLSHYGKISIPPSDIKMAYEISVTKGIPLHAIDVDDDEYADLLIKNVSTISLIKYSRKIKKLGKKNFKARDAEEFIREWDEYMTSIKSFKKIEEAREEKMAENVKELCKKCKKMLVIVPMERYDGFIERLERYKK